MLHTICNVVIEAGSHVEKYVFLSLENVISVNSNRHFLTDENVRENICGLK